MASGFYDNSILSGTKIVRIQWTAFYQFYDNSILSGTKILLPACFRGSMFYDNSILSGTKISNFKIFFKYF